MLSRVLILILLLSLQTSAKTIADSFYVWQQNWSSNVVLAVSQESSTSLYPLACVVPAQGHATLIDLPWAELAALDHRYIPTIRIPVSAFRRTDIRTELISITTQLIHECQPTRMQEIQLDLDCPERLLSEYTELVKEYRKAFPDLKLSITALPSHLSNKNFRLLAETVDEYILQVHGLEVPRKLADPAELMNLSTAIRAVERAEKTGLPYRLALPCYAYELNFDRESTRFLGLTAEGPAMPQNTVKKRVAASPQDLTDVIRRSQSCKHLNGIIWFRLPVEGDRLCWPRSTLAKIQSGSIPETKVTCSPRTISSATMELELYNANSIEATEAVIALEWPESTGSFDLYRDARLGTPQPGQLPKQLTVMLPAPGQCTRIGWFQSAQPPTTTIELK